MVTFKTLESNSERKYFRFVSDYDGVCLLEVGQDE